jgi:[NiFe] hydrogenase diaphorase moiety small subunit
MRVAINADHGLSETVLSSADKAAALCPTGSIVIKRQGFRVPYGKRPYDKMPIGSDIEKKRTHK